jgi:hypothetical protein
VIKEVVQERLAIARGAERQGDFGLQIVDVFRDEIGKIGVLRVIPNLFDRIKVWRVGRQPFDGNAGGLKTLGRGAVSIEAVPHQEELASELATQRPNELLRVDRSDVVAKDHEVQTDPPPLRRDREYADHREPVMSVPTVKDRRVPSRRPGASHQRLEHEAALIK